LLGSSSFLSRPCFSLQRFLINTRANCWLAGDSNLSLLKNVDLLKCKRFLSIIVNEGVVGHIMIFPPDQEYSPGYVEVACFILPGYARKNLMTTVATASLQYITMENQSYKTALVATAHPDNKPSQSLLEKLWFQPIKDKQRVEKYCTIRNYYHLSSERLEKFCSYQR
jgi:RimJ/RimL family protein N-acetyltransferase